MEQGEAPAPEGDSERNQRPPPPAPPDAGDENMFQPTPKEDWASPGGIVLPGTVVPGTEEYRRQKTPPASPGKSPPPHAKFADEDAAAGKSPSPKQPTSQSPPKSPTPEDQEHVQSPGKSPASSQGGSPPPPASPPAVAGKGQGKSKAGSPKHGKKGRKGNKEDHAEVAVYIPVQEEGVASVLREDKVLMVSASKSGNATVVETYDIRYTKEEIYDDRPSVAAGGKLSPGYGAKKSHESRSFTLSAEQGGRSGGSSRAASPTPTTTTAAEPPGPQDSGHSAGRPSRVSTAPTPPPGGAAEQEGAARGAGRPSGVSSPAPPAAAPAAAAEEEGGAPPPP